VPCRASFPGVFRFEGFAMGVDTKKLEQALAVWQSRAKRALTNEDGREIAANMAGFFTLLQQWSRFRDEQQSVSTRTGTEGGDVRPGV
jgi:hypothetical protein